MSKGLSRYWDPVPYFVRSDFPARTDVTIIGAGIAGLALARMLAAESIDFCIIEERPVLGLGISGGQIGTARIGLADNFFRLHNSLGAAESSNLLRYSQQGIDFLKQLGLLTGSGGLELAANPREWQELKQSHLLLRAVGIESALVGRTELNSCQQHFYGALHLPMEGILSSAKLLQELSKGIEIVNAKVQHVLDHGLLAVETNRGVIETTTVVIANGWHSQQLHPLLEQAITPVRVQAIALPTQSTQPFSCSAQYGYLEWRNTKDHLLISGCRWATPHLEVGESDDTIWVGAIAEKLQQAASQLGAHSSPSHRWSSIVAGSCDQLPLIGPLNSSSPIYACCGFNGRQTALGVRAAQSVLQFLLNGSDPELPSSCSATRLSQQNC